MARDWNAIKAAYIAGVAGPELARKYKVPLATLESRSSREKWGALRKEAANKVQASLPGAVAAAIVDRAADEGIMTRDEVLRRLSAIARGGMQRLATWGPDGVKLKASDDLTEEERALVAEVAETINAHGTAVRIKAFDSLAALRELAKHYGIVGDERPAEAPQEDIPSHEDLMALGEEELRRRIDEKLRESWNRRQAKPGA